MLHFSLEQERQIEARERALEELDRATRENLALHSQLVEQARAAGIAEERARLSREIHDTVAQGLVGVIRQLEAVPEDLPKPASERVARAERAARECLVEARRAVQALAPHQLRNGDLVEAVGNLSAEWARAHRVVIEFDADEAPPQLDHGPVLLRVIQESLANVARHAQASNVKVVLRGSETEEEVVVVDDGVGFDPDNTSSGHGLPGMVARVAAFGGRVAIKSREGHGCMITATVPR
jgi:signal transduction histidine kinase